jgi:outer membrane receptor protein involved in Fe transport
MNANLLSGASAAVIAICISGVGAPACAADAAAAAQQAATVGEVVVIAEKRAQKLETVPVAVSAYSAEQRDLMGIKSVQDLTDYTPGLSYTTVDNRPYIRGIGRNTDNLAVETGVAVYVDQEYDSVFNRYYNSAPAYSQVNLQATWTDVKNRYSFILFCNNVFNTIGYDGDMGLLASAPGPGQAVDPIYTLTAPRTYGVELQYRFR